MREHRGEWLPSGPGAPRFRATFENASPNRSATSFIVASVAFPPLFAGFGTARVADRFRDRSAPPSEPARADTSAVPENRESCFGSSSTGIASTPARDSTRRVTPAFRRACALSRSSDFCRVITFRSLVLRATARAEPGRPPWVSAADFATAPSPLRPCSPTRIGLRPWRRAHRSTNALRRFTFVRNGRAPMTPSDLPSRVASDEARTSSSASSRCSGSTPLSLQCRVPRVRAPGLDFHLLSAAPAWRTSTVLRTFELDPVAGRRGPVDPRHRAAMPGLPQVAGGAVDPGVSPGSLGRPQLRGRRALPGRGA